MAIKDRIKEMRQARNLTQEQLAKRIGVAKSTLAGYETGIREPGIEIIGKIMHELDIDANYLWQDEGNFQMQVSYLEMEHIKKYHDLDDFGKKHIDYELDREVTRVKELSDMKDRIKELETSQATVIDIQPHLEVNAAHARTDIDVTDEDQAHDDAIMNDDSEWE